MKGVKRTIAIVCVAVLVMSLSACGDKVSTKEFEWPTTGLATMLPEPTTLRGEINWDESGRFSADISKITEDDYEEYVEACKDKGFTVDIEESDSKFHAYNEDGYIISVTYYPDEEYYEINFYEPRFEAGETFSWPTTGLATLLPEPASNIGKISYESSTRLSLYVGESTIDDFNNYVDACINAGFDVDYRRDDTYFHAKNEAGETLTLSYEGYNTFSIQIDSHGNKNEDATSDEEKESIEDGEYSEFSWPDSEIAKLLPVPKSNIGKIEWAEDYGFVIYVAETSKEDYDAYVNEVQEAGFTVDSHKSDDAFWADNEDGYHVYLTFEDNDVMFVRMDEPDEEESEENTEEVQETEDTEDTEVATSDSASSVAGVSDEFKAAMDSYEEFFDDYVEFMKKYNGSGDTTDMLSDLNDYMTKYSETMDKFNALGDDDMTPEEVKYYAEVTERIYNKLAELN